MINMALRAKNGVRIPNIKATCHEILHMFNSNMVKLKECLNVHRSIHLRSTTLMSVIRDQSLIVQ